MCLHKEYLYLSKNQADIGTYISYKAWKSSPLWLMHDNLAQVTYWWTRFEAQDLFMCFVQSKWDDVMYLQPSVGNMGMKTLWSFFSSVTEMKKTNSCHLNRWVFLIWYCTVSCSQLCLTWISCEKEHFTLKKFHIWISFFKARRHWTTSHKVNKEFTSCKYLLQACLSLEILASALSKWVSGK